jgi:hypothetical protein
MISDLGSPNLGTSRPLMIYFLNVNHPGHWRHWWHWALYGWQVGCCMTAFNISFVQPGSQSDVQLAPWVLKRYRKYQRLSLNASGVESTAYSRAVACDRQ